MPSFDFITENWENEHDFYYINQSDYVYPEQYETPEVSDISTYVVSKATKAKFRFPSKDPDDNTVVDNRNDSEKVKDILRIWSQLLTSDESDIWNEIADRDLTRKISLESGIRTPKTFIENEIKAFRNLKAAQKIELIKALDKAPEFHNTDRESEISQPVIDSTRLECELDVDEEFLSHYGCLLYTSALPTTLQV